MKYKHLKHFGFLGLNAVLAFVVIFNLSIAGLAQTSNAGSSQAGSVSSKEASSGMMASSSAANSSSSQAGAVNVQTSEKKGEIIKKEGDKITLKMNDETKMFTVPNNIKISRNTLDAKIDDIQAGDQATLTLTQDSQVLKLDAVSSDTMNIARNVILGLLALILVAILIWYILSRSNKGKIKTSVASNIE